MPEVRQERSGWRDLGLSDRHRRWGWNCPAVDLDFLFLEYDKGLPTAVIEYKNEHAGKVALGHPTYHAIKALCDKAEIPFIICRYTDDYNGYYVTAANRYAEKHIPPTGYKLTEVGWVKFLYKLRGYDCPQDLLDGLKVAV